MKPRLTLHSRLSSADIQRAMTDRREASPEITERKTSSSKKRKHTELDTRPPAAAGAAAAAAAAPSMEVDGGAAAQKVEKPKLKQHLNTENHPIKFTINRETLIENAETQDPLKDEDPFRLEKAFRTQLAEFKPTQKNALIILILEKIDLQQPDSFAALIHFLQTHEVIELQIMDGTLFHHVNLTYEQYTSEQNGKPLLLPSPSAALLVAIATHPIIKRLTLRQVVNTQDARKGFDFFLRVLAHQGKLLSLDLTRFSSVFNENDNEPREFKQNGNNEPQEVNWVEKNLEEATPALAYLLQYNQTLAALLLAENGITHKILRSLVLAWLQNPASGIRTLNLDNNHIDDACAHELEKILKHQGVALQVLSLQYSLINNVGLVRLARPLQQNQTLRTLILSAAFSTLSDRGVIALCDALKQNPKSALRELALEKIYNPNPDYQKRSIGPEGAKAIGALLALPHCVLTSLNLRGHSIGTGLEAIAEGLIHNRTLTSLLLARNNIEGTRGLTLLGLALFDNESLGEIDLNDNWIPEEATWTLVEALVKNRTLHTARLNGCNFSHEAEKKWALMLQKNPIFAHLDVPFLSQKFIALLERNKAAAKETKRKTLSHQFLAAFFQANRAHNFKYSGSVIFTQTVVPLLNLPKEKEGEKKEEPSSQSMRMSQLVSN